MYNVLYIYRHSKYSLNVKNLESSSPVLTTQNLIRILYLPTQIKMVIVYWNPDFKRGVQDFLCINWNNHLKKKTCTCFKAINSPTQHEFLAKTNQMLKYTNILLQNIYYLMYSINIFALMKISQINRLQPQAWQIYLLIILLLHPKAKGVRCLYLSQKYLFLFRLI